MREQIALAVAENNHCDYCLSAHTFLGKHAGLSDGDVARARQGRAADLKADAAVRFAQSLLESRGHPSDAELAERARPASATAKSSKSLPSRCSMSSPTA